jgi:hydroxypyruvate reductase 2
LLISVLRRIPAADRYVRSGNWAKFGDFQLGSKVCSKSQTLNFEF